MRKFFPLVALLFAALLLLPACGEEEVESPEPTTSYEEYKQMLEQSRVSFTPVDTSEPSEEEPAPTPTLSPEEWDELIEKRKEVGLYPIYSKGEVVGWTYRPGQFSRPSPEPSTVPAQDPNMRRICGRWVSVTSVVVELVNPLPEDVAMLTDFTDLRYLSIRRSIDMDIPSPETRSITLPDLPKLETVNINNTFEDTELDLSACSALTSVSLRDWWHEPPAMPAKLLLPQSLEYFESVFVPDLDYLATLPNLKTLYVQNPFDLSMLKGFPSGVKLRITTTGWDLSPLADVELETIDMNIYHNGAQAVLNTFKGAKGLKEIAISDNRCSDIRNIIDHSEGLKQLTIYIDPQGNYGGEWNDETHSYDWEWYDTYLTEENIKDIDKLNTSIPLDQILELYNRGITVYFAFDMNRQEI